MHSLKSLATDVQPHQSQLVAPAYLTATGSSGSRDNTVQQPDLPADGAEPGLTAPCSHTSTVAFMERGLEWDSAPGSAIVRVPEGEVRGGLVMLHGASDGRARQPLFDQVAQVVAPMGVAVLSYERRPVERGDTPLGVQAADAVAAMRALRIELRCRVGVFGFSQGAWAAALAAADESPTTWSCSAAAVSVRPSRCASTPTSCCASTGSTIAIGRGWATCGPSSRITCARQRPPRLLETRSPPRCGMQQKDPGSSMRICHRSLHPRTPHGLTWTSARPRLPEGARSRPGDVGNR